MAKQQVYFTIDEEYLDELEELVDDNSLSVTTQIEANVPLTSNDEHPCRNCKSFFGWVEVKAYVPVMGEESICVDIPVCDRVIHILTLGKCKYFKLKNEVETDE